MIIIKVIYKKSSGKIIGVVPKLQRINNLFNNRSEKFYSDLDTVPLVDNLDNLNFHYVKEGKVCRYNEVEISEVLEFGEVLSVEDRILNELKPSLNEIQKAENTIEILELLLEVL